MDLAGLQTMKSKSVELLQQKIQLRMSPALMNMYMADYDVNAAIAGGQEQESAGMACLERLRDAQKKIEGLAEVVRAVTDPDASGQDIMKSVTASSESGLALPTNSLKEFSAEKDILTAFAAKDWATLGALFQTKHPPIGDATVGVWLVEAFRVAHHHRLELE